LFFPVISYLSSRLLFGDMKKYPLLFIFCSLFVLSTAMAEGPHNKDKTDRDKCPDHAVPAPEGLGELMFLLTPPTAEVKCHEKVDLRRGMTEFCKWYLQHEGQINTYQSSEDSVKELMLPIDVSWQNLQEYFDFIRKNYPDIIESVSGTAAKSNPAPNAALKPSKEHRGVVSAADGAETDSLRTGFYAIANKY